jgi:hypothetical protein
MAYSVLKSANCVPQEIALLNDVARAEAELAAACSDEAHRLAAAELQDARLRLGIALERHRADIRRRD